MAKMNCILTDKITGKKLLEFSWPVMPIKTIDENENLTDSQKKKLKSLLNREIKIAQNHFNKDLAYNLDSSFLLNEIIDDFFGFNLSDLLITQVCHQSETGYTFENGKSVFKNYKDKVFYNEVKNKIYVDKSARNLDTDIQLGDL